MRCWLMACTAGPSWLRSPNLGASASRASCCVCSSFSAPNRKLPFLVASIVANQTFDFCLALVLKKRHAEDLLTLPVEVDPSVEVIGESGGIQNVLLCVQRRQSKPPPLLGIIANSSLAAGGRSPGRLRPAPPKYSGCACRA